MTSKGLTKKLQNVWVWKYVGSVKSWIYYIVACQGSGVSIKSRRPNTDKGHPLPFNLQSKMAVSEVFVMATWTATVVWTTVQWAWHATIYFLVNSSICLSPGAPWGAKVATWVGRGGVRTDSWGAKGTFCYFKIQTRKKFTPQKVKGLIKVHETGRWAHINVKLLHLRRLHVLGGCK